MSRADSSRPATQRTCARCGRTLKWYTNRWPEGYICSTCHTWALETYGTCTGCAAERMTPGITPGGGRLCTDCAGIPGDYFCVCCGQEGRRQRQGVCARCILTDRLNELLDDGTGAVNAELIPLFDALRTVKRPRSMLTWTGYPHVQLALRTLARGEIPLTHHGLSQLAPWRSAAYLRDLLMQCGVLPHADRHLLLFERWLAEWLGTVAEASHRQLLEHFASWRILRRLRAIADQKAVGSTRSRDARRKLVQAATFLSWLDAQGQTLRECRQNDLDAWHAEDFIARRPAHAFLRWCMDTDRMPRLEIPARSTLKPAPITQHQRINLIRQALTVDQLPLRDRVAALLVLLYAQPITWVTQLTIDDITHEGPVTMIKLGDPPSPVPEPFAELLLAYLRERPNTTTATNPDTRWLFPGRRAGQPMDVTTIHKRLRKLGIPTRAGRTATIRQLVLQAPAPVVARMLGYHDDTTTRLASDVGTPWIKYAPGDHSR